MMTRFVLAATVLSCALISMALSADVPENPSSLKPASANAAPVYVKLLLPDDPAAPVVEGDSTVIESWIIKSIDEEQRQTNHRAVTGWVRLVDEPFPATDLWDGGKRDRVILCPVGADIFERKDGWIKISFHGWTPGGAITKVTLKDEPGSREVVPVTTAKMKHGMPHVAVFISVRVNVESLELAPTISAAVEPDVGLPDGGDARLLPGIDVGETLGADGTSLLGGAEG